MIPSEKRGQALALLDLCFLCILPLCFVSHSVAVSFAVVSPYAALNVRQNRCDAMLPLAAREVEKIETLSTLPNKDSFILPVSTK